MRRLRHRFHSPDQTGLRLAQLNHLRAGHDRLNPAAAKAVHSQRRAVIGNTGFQGNMPRAVNSIAGSLQRVAEDCVVDLFRSHAGCTLKSI